MNLEVANRMFPACSSPHPIRDNGELYGILRVRVRALEIGESLLRAAKYSDEFSTSDTYVVNSEGVYLSPSHFSKRLCWRRTHQHRSMLELKVQPPDRSEFTERISTESDGGHYFAAPRVAIRRSPVDFGKVNLPDTKGYWETSKSARGLEFRTRIGFALPKSGVPKRTLR